MNYCSSKNILRRSHFQNWARARPAHSTKTRKVLALRASARWRALSQKFGRACAPRACISWSARAPGRAITSLKSIIMDFGSFQCLTVFGFGGKNRFRWKTFWGGGNKSPTVWLSSSVYWKLRFDLVSFLIQLVLLLLNLLHQWRFESSLQHQNVKLTKITSTSCTYFFLFYLRRLQWYWGIVREMEKEP